MPRPIASRVLQVGLGLLVLLAAALLLINACSPHPEEWLGLRPHVYQGDFAVDAGLRGTGR